MSDIKISALPGASTLTGAETIPVVQGGVTKKVTTDQFLIKDASGNVGIGTASPSSKLDVRGLIEAGNGTIRGCISYSTRVELGSLSNHDIGFIANSATQAVLTTSGNLGLGVTPSAWTLGKAIEVGTNGNALWGATGTQLNLLQNAYWDSGYKYATSNPATYYQQTSGSHVWYTAPSGTAGNPISFTQVMTLDSSGRLQLGAATVDAFDVARLSGTNAIANDLSLHGPSTSQVRLQFSRTGAYGRGEVGYNMATDTLRFVVADSQAMTLDSSGNLLVGTTSGSAHSFRKNNSSDYALNVFNGSASDPLGVRIYYDGLASGGNAFLNCIDTGATRLIIAGTGNVTNVNNSYGAISDAKLKDNITDVNPKLAKLMQVRIVNYTLKSDPDKTKLIGVVAQELEKVSPGLIEETADRDAEGNDLGTTTKSVKYSVFVPMLIKSLQEQQAQIEALEARLAAAGI